jgi:hypothetical protein
MPPSATSVQGELLTLWTVRAAVLLYVLALALRITAPGRPRFLALARLVWTAGFFALLLHVACAFHFFHGWSHADAYTTTAVQTAEVTGLRWGGGLYVNYLFMLTWAADVAWWWARPEQYSRRSPFFECAVQGFLGFIVFNALVVFKEGFLRWAGVGACLVLVAVWATRRPLT